MKAIYRLTLLFALATWFALGISSQGGASAGGTGVWILPRAVFLPDYEPGVAARGTNSMATLGSNLTLTAASDVGQITATIIDPVSGVVVGLPVSGRDVTLSGSLLKSLRDAGCPSVDVVISDSTHLGYVISITFDAATDGASLRAF